MTLIYRFKKEKLDSGSQIARPKIVVVIGGPEKMVEVPALIDSGCDVTVIPDNIAKLIGLEEDGDKQTLYGFRESAEAVPSAASFRFSTRNQRQEVTINRIPVLIVEGDESEITLGVAGVFDAFDITFRKSRNRIVLKQI